MPSSSSTTRVQIKGERTVVSLNEKFQNRYYSFAVIGNERKLKILTSQERRKTDNLKIEDKKFKTVP